MQLILVPEAKEGGATGTADLLRYGLSTPPLNHVLLCGLHHLWRCQRTRDLARWVDWTRPADSLWGLPDGWRTEGVAGPGHIVFQSDASHIKARELDGRRPRPWIVVTNGRFATCVNCRLLEELFETTRADIVAVIADPDLMAYQEKVRFACDNELVGYRRLYADSMMPVPVDRPHHLFIRRNAFDAVVGDNLCLGFDALVDRARGPGMEGIAVAGTALDLGTAEGILALCRVALDNPTGAGGPTWPRPRRTSHETVAAQSRLIGPVLLGERVTVEAGAVIVGPAILCDDAAVRRGALVDSAIVGANATIEADETVRDCVVSALERGGERRTVARGRSMPKERICLDRRGVFRVWAPLSYAGGIKRVFDIAAALLVLILFVPVIAILALAVKINSRGPVFFRHRRQGRYGVPFDCVKFRTMMHGADRIQEKLRYISDVDGPQFKLADDPRITSVGRFLRETYIDEIPQFFNVLCGHMSVVGPRPSPEAENTLCPPWRDARLSVRPGITGLWQVCRTREIHKDFQEWIHYDMQYVRDLSLRLDLWICWRTFRKMVVNFINQF